MSAPFAPDINPRFVWLIGSIRVVYPDLPENPEVGELVMWDRLTNKACVTLATPYRNLFCLETTYEVTDAPFSGLCEWMNKLTDEELTSEGIPV